jgi:drug/metabolite transporter (DMT)-like permease
MIRGFLRRFLPRRFNSNPHKLEVFELVNTESVVPVSNHRSNRAHPWSIWGIALGATMWGLDAVFIVALLHHFNATEIVWLEHALLLLFAVPVLVWKWREVSRLRLRDWLAVLFIAWGGSALASILFTQAFMVGNANVILLLQKLQPLFAVLMATWILKERMRVRDGFFFGFALLGAYLLTFGFRFPLQSHHLGSGRGALFALAAAALWGGSTVMGKHLLNQVSFVTTTALRFALAFPLLTLLVVIEHPHWVSLGQALRLWPVWANLLFQTLVPSLLSLLIYYQGLQGVRASHATLAELAFPATGLLVNYFILHQVMTFGQGVGFIVIWAAVYGLSQVKNKVLIL